MRLLECISNTGIQYRNSSDLQVVDIREATNALGMLITTYV